MGKSSLFNFDRHPLSLPPLKGTELLPSSNPNPAEDKRLSESVSSFNSLLKMYFYQKAALILSNLPAYCIYRLKCLCIRF